MLRYITPITDKENKRAKSELSFAVYPFLIFKLSLGFGVDFVFGLILTFELGLGLGLDNDFLFLHSVTAASAIEIIL